MAGFHDEERALQDRIRQLEQQLKETGVNPQEVGTWNSDSINRAREVIRMQIKDLPLVHRVNDIKESIEAQENNVNRENPMLADELVRER